jgi:hypothetical protein
VPGTETIGPLGDFSSSGGIPSGERDDRREAELGLGMD